MTPLFFIYNLQGRVVAACRHVRAVRYFSKSSTSPNGSSRNSSPDTRVDKAPVPPEVRMEEERRYKWNVASETHASLVSVDHQNAV